MVKLASETQMTVLNEEIQGQEFYKSLTFEEFLLFIVNCALFVYKEDLVKKNGTLDNMVPSDSECSDQELKQSFAKLKTWKRASGASPFILGEFKSIAHHDIAYYVARFLTLLYK